jgi:hypothetical protein
MAHGYVRQSDIEKGYLEGTKNADVKILKECNGKSLLGGVGTCISTSQSYARSKC